MHKRFRHLYYIIAMTLNIAMVLTGMPNMILMAKAAEKIAVELEESAVESIETAVTEEVGTIDAVDEIDAILSDDAIIQEYQTTKLKVTKKTTSFYYGDENVLVAEINYDGSTREEGLGYTCTVIEEPVETKIAGQLSFNTSDPHKLVIDTVSCAPGKYIVRLTPKVPTGVKAEFVDLTLTVKSCITKIEMERIRSGIYKPGEKAVTVKMAQVTCYDAVGNVVKNPKLTWYVAQDSEGKYPYDSKMISVKNGTVTVAKEVDISIFSYKGLYIIAKANDKPGATTFAYESYGAYSETSPIKTVVVNVGDIRVKDGIITYQDYCKNKKNSRIIAFNTAGSIPMTNTNLQYTSSKPKEISVDNKGYITIHKVTGNPVKITVTAVDGSKQTIEITVKDTIESLNNLEFKIQFLNKDDYGAQTFVTSEDMGEVEIHNGRNNWFALYTTQDISNLKITKVKGAKDITSKLSSLKKKIGLSGYVSWIELQKDPQFALLPTAEYIEVTFQHGKETKVVKFHNVSFAKTTNKSIESDKKLDTSMTVYKVHGEQNIKFYVGKQNYGGLVTFLCPADYVNNAGEYFTASALTRDGILGVRSFSIDKEGYVTIPFIDVDTMERAYKLYYGRQTTAANKLKVKCCVILSVFNGEQYVPYDVTITLKNPPKAKYSFGSKIAITAHQDKLENCASYSKVYASKKNGECVTVTNTYAGKLNKELMAASALSSCITIKATEAGLVFAIPENQEAYLAESYGHGKKVTEPIFVEYEVWNEALGITQTKTEKINFTYTTVH